MTKARRTTEVARSGNSKGFDRAALPEPLAYYESQGIILMGKGPWRTAPCPFHGGSDSMRINLKTGGFTCMAGCGAKGGDVLAYHMASYGIDFVSAAKALGAWVDNGDPTPRRPTALSPRTALQVLGFESSIVALAASNVVRGVKLSDTDYARLLVSVSRIEHIVRYFG